MVAGEKGCCRGGGGGGEGSGAGGELCERGGLEGVLEWR